MHLDPLLPPVFSRQEALAAGVTRHQVDRRVTTGTWTVLRRGQYAVTEHLRALPDRDRRVLAAVATLRAREDVVLSHVSAASVYGWPLPLEGADSTTVTSGELARSTVRRGDLVVQVASLPDGDVWRQQVDAGGHAWDLRLTAPARTVADNLRHLRLPDAVALGDGALRGGLTSYEAVAAVLRRQETWPYAANGHAALPLLDPRRETWLESYSFVVLHACGLPMPEPQVTLLDARGRFVARVDGLVDDVVVCEPDGRGKYVLGADVRLGADPDQAADDLARHISRRVLAEKDREDRIRDLGAEVVRWGAARITGQPYAVADQVEAARRRGAGRQLTGRASYLPRPAWHPSATRSHPSRHAAVRRSARFATSSRG